MWVLHDAFYRPGGHAFMNTDPDSIYAPEDMPMMPAGELPDMDDLPPDEPSGPPTATNDPFGLPLVNGAHVGPRLSPPFANPPRP